MSPVDKAALAYAVLASVPVLLWLFMEIDARKNGAREAARRKRARKGYLWH